MSPEASADASPDAEDANVIGRRRFLRWVSGIGSAVIGILVGVPVIRSFLSPALGKTKPSRWIKVAEDIALIDLGVPVRAGFVQDESDAWVEAQVEEAVWLYTDDGEKFKAYNSHCTHLGCSYGYDKASNTFLCPCHRGQFDVKTGAVLAGPPPRPLDTLPVEIRDSAVFVDYTNFRPGVPQKVSA